MTIRIFTLIIFFAAILVTSLPASAQVAFISDRGGELDIYTFDTDTSDIRKLTEPGEVEYGVTWSRDGEFIYFVRYKIGDQNLWRIRPDGSDLQKLTEGEHQRNLNDISPDGKRMLINSKRENPQGDTYTMDIDGKNVRRLTENAFFELGAGYSPDGKNLVIAVQTVPSPDKSWSGNSELFLYDVDGNFLRQITKTDSTLEALPAYSPDGRKIAYHGCEHGKCGVFVVDLESGKSSSLTQDDPDSRWPRWTPDGKWIAYTRVEGGGTDVWLMRPDGSDKRPFITGPGKDEIAAFGPKMVKIPGN